MTEQPTLPPEQEESELIRVRREKLARIVELGYDAFPTKADVDVTLAEVVAKFGGRTAEELEAAVAAAREEVVAALAPPQVDAPDGADAAEAAGPADA